MAAIAPASVDELLNLIRKSGILSPARLKEVPGSDALPADPRKAAAALLAQGFLTKFQCAQLLAGRHRGFRVGPYAILDLLGRGGMGAVYLAEHLELHRKVAVKVLTPIKGAGARLAVERFLREGRAAGALDHPNIIRVFDATRHQDTPCLIMEYVDGETLQQHIDREGAMPAAVAAECIAQAAAGLQHAHERGFIHRDIKPGNLMRDKDGVVKILDMGLARSGSEEDKLTELLDHGAVVGTADFISPEQAINSPKVDGRADIYSLGATFYAVLAGRPPFTGNTAQKLMQHQLRDAPALATLCPGLPPGIAEVVARMLAKKPADRYQCGGEVVAALAPWTGSSARVVAALSRTNLGQSAALIARASHSSTALGAAPPKGEAESGIVDPSEAARGTVELRASETMRDRVAAARAAHEAPESAPRRRRGLIALLVVAFLASAGFAGWLAAGGWSSIRGSVGAPVPVPHPNPDPTAEKTVFRLAAADLPEFKLTKRGRTATAGADLEPQLKGVHLVGWREETVSEWRCGAFAGERTLAFANIAGPASAQIMCALEEDHGLGFTFKPGQRLRLRVTYRTTGTGNGSIYFQNTDNHLLLGQVSLPNSDSAWKMVETVVTRGTSPLRCQVNADALGAENALHVREVAVTELGPSKN